MPPFFDFSDLPPVSQSNSSLKKHRSRSIFSPFFCCFRNYNDYHVEPPPANNKTLSLPPTPEENGSPPKVKLRFPLTSYLAWVQIAQHLQTRDQKMKKRELVNTRQESLFDSRDPVTSNICLVLLTESLLRFAFSCRELCSLAELPPQIFPAATNPLNPAVVYHPLLENTGSPPILHSSISAYARGHTLARTHTTTTTRSAELRVHPLCTFFWRGLAQLFASTRGNTCTHTLAHIQQLL